MTFRNKIRNKTKDTGLEISSGLPSRQEAATIAERPIARRVSRLIGAAADRMTFKHRGLGAGSGKRSTETGESVSSTEAQRSMLSTNELRVALEDAFDDNDKEAVRAVVATLVGRGRTDTDLAAQELGAIAGNAPVDSKTAQMAAYTIRHQAADLGAVSPDLTRWASISGAPNKPTLGEVTADPASYREFSLERMVNWSSRTINNAHAAAHMAGGVEWVVMQRQVRDLLGSEYANMLSYPATQKYNAIAKGEAPAL